MEDLQAGVKYHKIHHTKKTKIEDEGETILPGKELEQKKKRIMISKLIPDLLSCPTHLCGILEKKRPSCMYNDFHAHLVETHLKTQESTMHENFKEKLNRHFPYILKEERYRLLGLQNSHQ